jgi:hypothetical protein
VGRLTLPFIVFLLAVWLVDSSFYEALAVSFSLYTFLTFVDCIGQRIAILECISAIASLEILAVPAVAYWVFPASMPIESTSYFSYALPACLAFYAGIYGVAANSSAYAHQHSIQRVVEYLHYRKGTPFILLTIGLAGFLLKLIMPAAPAFLSTLPMYCLLVSALYAYYARSEYRALLIGLVVVLLLANTVRTGMFGDLFFWLLLLLIFSTVNLQSPLTSWVKTSLISAAFAFLLIIQSIKAEYRYNTWGNARTERTANAGLMAELLIDRFTYPEKLLNTRHLFASFGRFNQGIMIGSAMAKVPMHEAYANGEVLLALIYPLIPRLFWPGKPQTGGYENIRRFTTLPQFENTSINLSPVGEGYVNFGYGGILFACFYGLLLRGCFQYVFVVAEKIPSVILWLPMLYIGCLTMETDLLSTWGSLVNSALFMAILFWSMKTIGIEL